MNGKLTKTGEYNALVGLSVLEGGESKSEYYRYAKI